jgi:hypothetical protein
MQFDISRVNNQSMVLKKGGFKLHSDYDMILDIIKIMEN